MLRRKQTSTNATQLSLFAVEEERRVTPPVRLSQTFDRKELSLEMIEKREQFLEWGRRNDYPGFTFYPSLFNGSKTIMNRGELAWKQALLHQPMDWVIAAHSWLEEGATGDAHFLRMIRRNRSEMLLEYARKQKYPRVTLEGYTFDAGIDAWKVAAFDADLCLIEAAITALASLEEGV